MNSTAITEIASWVSILFLVAFIFWSYRQFVLESFRQKLFALRDEMFDYAAEGNMDFSHPAYVVLRQTMNGMIRFGHRMNFPFALSLMVVRQNAEPDAGTTFKCRLDTAKRSLPPAQQKAVDNFRVRMDFLMIEYLVQSSPIILLTIILPAAFLIEGKRRADQLVHLVRRPLDRIDAVAYATAEG
jgi:hypothetical protein